MVGYFVGWKKAILGISKYKTTTGTTRVPEISHLRAENYSDSNEKKKTTSVDKYIDILSI